MSIVNDRLVYEFQLKLFNYVGGKWSETCENWNTDNKNNIDYPVLLCYSLPDLHADYLSNMLRPDEKIRYETFLISIYPILDNEEDEVPDDFFYNNASYHLKQCLKLRGNYLYSLLQKRIFNYVYGPEIKKLIKQLKISDCASIVYEYLIL